MAYTESERRRYPRLNQHFLVRYWMLGGVDETDLCQVRDISLGGIRLTTGKPFENGAKLVLKIRLPGGEIMPTGRVLESRQFVKAMPVCDTRLEFSEINESERKTLGDTLDNYLKKQKI